MTKESTEKLKKMLPSLNKDNTDAIYVGLNQSLGTKGSVVQADVMGINLSMKAAELNVPFNIFVEEACFQSGM